ncbi:MAG: dienelactone hydrolase family protein [Planctomycetes bacterium]|nr:dienelactone hydrolase family protein [Planctomycetota bacterium]
MKQITLLIPVVLTSILPCINDTLLVNQDPTKDELKFSFQDTEFKLPLHIYLPEKKSDQKDEKKFSLILCYPYFPGTSNEISAMHKSYWGEEAKKRGIAVIYVEVGQQYYVRIATLVTMQNPAAIETLIEHSLKHILKKYPIDDKKIIITGASMGGQISFTAYNLFPNKFAACIPMPGQCSGEISKKLKNKHIFMIRGENENVQTSALMDQQAKELKEIGAKVKYEIIKGQPHIIQIDQKILFEWIDPIISKPVLSNPKEGKCLLCNKQIDENHIREHNNSKYGFCSQKCAEVFVKNPDKHIKPSKKS